MCEPTCMKRPEQVNSGRKEIGGCQNSGAWGPMGMVSFLGDKKFWNTTEVMRHHIKEGQDGKFVKTKMRCCWD